MKKTLHNSLAILLIGAMGFLSICANNTAEESRTTYELAALAADSYLRSYTYSPGATAHECSVRGSRICTIFATLHHKAQYFNSPIRSHLLKLISNAHNTFRNFDHSGTMTDKNHFIRAVVALLDTTKEHLSIKEQIECDKIIISLQSRLE